MPLIDGKAADKQWSKIGEVAINDVIAGHEIYFSAIHDGDNIAVKIRYPDETENREHKTLEWDASASSYRTGSKREDTIVLKWPLSPLSKNIRLDSDEPYHADIWYWKSFRTDPLGYADDKYQIYSKSPSKKASRLRSIDGSLFYLQRKGDTGSSAYQTRLILEKNNLKEPKYEHRQPTGSRGDIKAKGLWQNGSWTIEFSRKLNTGNSDDIKLIPGEEYLLGLSRYEIAGRKPNNTIQEPYFGAGEVGELIKLFISK